MAGLRSGWRWTGAADRSHAFNHPLRDQYHRIGIVVRLVCRWIGAGFGLGFSLAILGPDYLTASNSFTVALAILLVQQGAVLTANSEHL
jgi:hypothetical protein